MPERPSQTGILLSRWQDGDREALNTLLERDLPWIRNFVRRRLGPALRQKLDPADVVQETLVEFLRHRPRSAISNRGEFRRLLIRLVQNVLGHQYARFTAQRRTLYRERPLSPDVVLDLERREGSDAHPTKLVHEREREALVRLGLGLLEPADQEVIVLREWQGLSLTELSERLRVSPDAARMRFHRAVRRLAKAVRKLRSEGLTESRGRHEEDAVPLESEAIHSRAAERYPQGP